MVILASSEMQSDNLSLIGATYRLGEQRRRCADLADFAETLARHDLSCLPHGLGEYRPAGDVFASGDHSQSYRLRRMRAQILDAAR